MRVIHASDLHFSIKKEKDIKIILEAFLNDLSSQLGVANDGDVFVFTGDLTFSGAPEEFELAEQYFIDPLINELGFAKTRILICPGNHDVVRSNLYRRSVESLRREIDSQEDLNSYLDNDFNTKDDLFQLDNFYEFIERKLSTAPVGRLYGCNQLEYLGQSFAFIQLNSAWNSYGGEEEKERIFLGERPLDDAVNESKGVDFRVACLHHPVDWFAEHDRNQMEAMFSREFNLVLCGHLHNTKLTSLTSTIGSTIYSQAGSLFNEKRERYHGYTIIEIDQRAEINFLFRKYFDTRRAFDTDNELAEGGRYSASLVKKKEIDDKVLNYQKIKSSFLENSELTLPVGVFGNNKIKSISDIFVEPKFGEKSATDSEFIKASSSLGEENEGSSKDLELSEIVNSEDDFVIYGDKESGKTTLLYYICESFICKNTNDTFPIYIDFSSLPNGKNIVRKCAYHFYHKLSSDEIDKIINQSHITLLIDNLDVEDTKKIKKIFKEELQNGCRIISVLDSRIDSDIDEISFSQFSKRCVKKAHIHPLARRQIKEVIKNYNGQVNDDYSIEDIDELTEKLVNLFLRTSISLTPQHIVFFMYVFSSEGAFEPINEASLIEKCIETLLKKLNTRNLNSASSDYKIKEDYLSLFSKEVYLKGGVLSFDDFNKLTADYFREKTIEINLKKFTESLFDSGILVYGRNNCVSFRLDYFRDYFFSKLMIDDRSILKKIIDEDDYLSYRESLLILGGLQRKNSYLIDSLESYLEKNLPEVQPIEYFDTDCSFTSLNLSTGDEEDFSSVKESLTELEVHHEGKRDEFAEQVDNLRQVMSPNGMGKILKNDEGDGLSTYRILCLVDMYATLIRYSDLIDGIDYKLQHVKNCLNFYYCVFGQFFLEFEELSEKVSQNRSEIARKISEEFNVDVQEGEAQVDSFTQALRRVSLILIPLSIQSQVYNSLGSTNLKKVLDQLLAHDLDNSLIEFYLVFLRGDIKLPGYLKAMTTFVKKPKPKFIQFSVLLKVMTYYMSRNLDENQKTELVSMMGFLLFSDKGSKRKLSGLGKKQTDSIKRALDSYKRRLG